MLEFAKCLQACKQNLYFASLFRRIFANANYEQQRKIRDIRHYIWLISCAERLNQRYQRAYMLLNLRCEEHKK